MAESFDSTTKVLDSVVLTLDSTTGSSNLTCPHSSPAPASLWVAAGVDGRGGDLGVAARARRSGLVRRGARGPGHGG
jgi:hypothetical protein